MQEASTSDSVEGNGQEMIPTLTHLLECVAEDPRKVKRKVLIIKQGFLISNKNQVSHRFDLDLYTSVRCSTIILS